MIKIDSIFKALNVETEDDVKLLAQYFVNHQQYLELIKHKSYVQTDRKVSFKETGIGPSSDVIDENSTSADADNNAIVITGLNQLQIDDETTTGVAEASNEATNAKSEKIIPTDKINLIHPNEVLTALKTFVAIHYKSKK